MLFFLIKLKYMHLACLCYPFGQFRRLGGFQLFVAALYRQSQGSTLLFRKIWTARQFSRRNSNPLLDFSLQRKERQSIGPFPGRLGKIFTLSAPIRTTFASLLELSTFQHTMVQLEINISDRSWVTNATYQTGAQSGERICILTEIRDKHRRTSRGGEGGCSPPSYRNF